MQGKGEQSSKIQKVSMLIKKLKCLLDTRERSPKASLGGGKVACGEDPDIRKREEQEETIQKAAREG
jgi:hypothetical protein